MGWTNQAWKKLMAQDMRSWIGQLESAGLLARIEKSVDPRSLVRKLDRRSGMALFGPSSRRRVARSVRFGTHRDEMISGINQKDSRPLKISFSSRAMTDPIRRKTLERAASRR
jgi:hypothetical protein